MQQRARSVDDKARRAEELLAAAEAIALELGGVRFVTLAPVTDRAGLHRTGVRRYYASKEELLLELAERGWRQWRDAISNAVAAGPSDTTTAAPSDATTAGLSDTTTGAPSDATTAGLSNTTTAAPSGGLGPREVATLLADTIAALPVFCDLLTHVTLSLEGDVDLERARRYKTSSFAAHDDIVAALDRASGMTVEQIRALMAAALALAASFWQVSHPTPTLAALYRQVPAWGHVALDFQPRLRLLLQSTAIGLAETLS
ncbi:TetR family transcriptional regulator [Dactylosporangium sp. CA-092794]|uniref:TetR family transcriptional regulator n=1 Tax=Dactylosporangium sp. CA-092794 TaxID=3239929 RepID=UPI003D943B37